MKTEEIQDRLERGYTMAIYGTRENIHEQMTNDIKTLLEAINYTRCCTELKIEDEIVFSEWLITHKFTRSGNVFLKNKCIYNEWDIFNMYLLDVQNL